jgi:UDP-glucuronate decarboxylase
MSLIHSDISEIISPDVVTFTRNKKILVTGASGLVGSYFAVLFQTLSQEHGGSIQLFLSSVSGKFLFPIEKGTNIIVGSLTSSDLLSEYDEFDLIVHAAGYAQPSKFLSQPIETMKLNIQVTIDLLQKLKKGGTLLYLSSSEVYSGLSEPPFTENQIGNSNTNHIRAPYIEAKKCGEVIVSTHNKLELGSRAVAVRLSLAYGPGTRSDDSRVLSSFISQAISSGKIEMKDSGSAWRTYCYVKDAVSQMVEILVSGKEELYNVGGESRVQILDLARIVAKLTEAQLLTPSESNPFQVGAPEDVSLDLSRVKAIWNKEEFTDIIQGISNTIEWARGLRVEESSVNSNQV